MLKSLYISNFALISEININFESGFSVITGETGAGKSIILGALSLLLGQRADSKLIKEGEEKCVIEAEFDIHDYQLEDFFEKNELDYNSSNCLLRREITVAGKSRAFVNDTPVSLQVLRELGDKLIDIHSQYENLLLSHADYQLQVVDTMAQNEKILENYRITFFEWKTLQNDFRQLQKEAEKQLAEFDYLQFQFQQLNDAHLSENEQTELEAEFQTLSHTEEIKEELQKAYYFLNEEQMAISMIKNAINSLDHIKNFIPEGENWYQRLQSVEIETKDIANEIISLEERIEFQPDRLQWIENRLNEIYALEKKFKVSTEKELISIRDNIKDQLEKIESFDDELADLQKKINEVYEQLIQQANILRETRIKATESIENYLKQQLSQLGMPYIQFKVEISETFDFTENGKDNVQFLFSANKNQSLQPVAQIASGGEISRLMLSIKSLVAHRAGLPTIIFDEIDTGVSGEIAHKMGQIMHDMSKDMQVIAITHLPQIASKGEYHYRVYKDESGEKAQTHIVPLNQEERVQEIAQMLSGENVTEVSLKNAEELLNINYFNN